MHFQLPTESTAESITPQWGSTRKAALLIGVAPSTLKTLAKDGKLPKPARLNARTLRWRLDELEKAMEEMRH